MRSMMSSALRKHGSLKLEGMADGGNIGTMWRGLFERGSVEPWNGGSSDSGKCLLGYGCSGENFTFIPGNTVYII